MATVRSRVRTAPDRDGGILGECETSEREPPLRGLHNAVAAMDSPAKMITALVGRDRSLGHDLEGAGGRIRGFWHRGYLALARFVSGPPLDGATDTRTLIL